MTEALTENDKQWNQQYEKMVEFERKNGHCIVPINYEQNNSLRRWVFRQQNVHRKDAMSQDRKNLLDALKFDWKSKGHDKSWNHQFEKLVEFRRKNGHCIMPPNYEQDKRLDNWVNKQRTYRKADKLRQDRKELLDELGFVWRAGSNENNWFDKKWEQQFEKLVEFKRKNGHCLVPQEHGQDDSLGCWVNQQRVLQNKNIIIRDRKELLDELGFVWRIEIIDKKCFDKKWKRQYEKLVEFKRKNGHCILRRGYEQDKSLGVWVGRQRTFLNNNKLRPDRKELLDELGFVWRFESAGKGHTAVADKIWRQHYEKLVEFKRTNGHCIVPTRGYEQDKALGPWVGTQRRYYANDTMRQDRKGLLNTLGFVWEAHTLAAQRSSTTDDVRDLISSRLMDPVRFLTLLLFVLDFCRNRIRKRPPAVWVSQTTLQKKRNQYKATLETDSNVHLP
jgi:uncharacterized protein YbgA (DUF1722 family)